MPTAAELTSLSRSRLQEARILLKARRFDAAVYLCGYAIEIALKARICKTLGWRQFPPRQSYQTFYTHSLAILLHLTGRERSIVGKRFGVHWDNVVRWDPESRYNAVGTATEASAKVLIESTRVLLREL